MAQEEILLKNSFRTDLACESRDVWTRTRGADLEGVSARHETRDGLGVETVEILDEEAAKELCKPMGRYTTISLDALVRREEDAFRRACGVLAREIRTQLAMEPDESVLVVGLGNPDITPDAIGPLAAECVLVTRHLKTRLPEEFAAFRSYNYPALAEVGVNITFHRDYIHRPAHADAELRVAAALDDRVLVIRLFPGLREQVLRAMLSIEGLRAVVLETYGAGNAPTAPEFIRAVREAVARGLLVMNVTQCSGGRVAMELYETGRQLQEAGVICGHDITTEAAVAKLMYVLGQNLPAERTQRLLRHALRGEFTDAGIA